MKDILIAAQFTQTPGMPGNGRFHYLATELSKTHQVELVTTSFYHATKAPRQIPEGTEIPYTFTTLREPGYKKNVSLTRFYSHWRYSLELAKYLKRRKKPDLLYCSVPSLDAARAAAKYARKHHIPFVLDVQDLWPEAFRMVFHIPVISDLIFLPMKRTADYIYRSADALVAVSRTYLDRALSVNSRCRSKEVVFLGTELDTFDRLKGDSAPQESGPFDIGYIGTLGHSYDIPTLIDAIALLDQRSPGAYRLLVMGDGPLADRFRQHAEKAGICAEFTGRLPYEEMVRRLSACHVAVNPIVSGSAGSIINKVGDYAAAGLPVVNTQECPEYRELLQTYHAGIHCENGKPEQMADAIEQLCTDRVLRQKMGAGNRRMAEELFDRGKSYQKICELIDRESLSCQP